MTARGFYTLFFGVLMLVTSLSVGSAGAFLLGCAALAAVLLSLIAALFAFFSMRLTQTVDVHDVARGEKCLYTLTVRCLSPLPVAPVSLRVCLPSGRQSEFLLKTRLFGDTVSENAFPCPHVGAHPVGVTHVRVMDCFSFFSLSRAVRAPLSCVTVLPRPIPTEPLTFSPGEGEASAIERAQADPTTPTDPRPWQDGDELKRVHWKLSMRRQALIVHTYEQNQRPDALVLLDFAQPDAPENRRALAVDLLTEACAGVIKALLDAGHAVRMPLSGADAHEASGLGSEALPGMLRALSTQPFTGPSEFSRALALSSRRMHRTGSTAILTTRLTARIADDVIALSKMGPHTYFTLVCAGEATAEQQTLLRLLPSSGVEARLVSPSAEI